MRRKIYTCELCGTKGYRKRTAIIDGIGKLICSRCSLELSALAIKRRKEFDRKRESLIAQNEHLRRGSCSRCGSGTNLSVDHIIPVIYGGTDDPSNLQVLCKSCNSSKGAR